MNSLGKQSVDRCPVEILACPVCKSDVRFKGKILICANDSARAEVNSQYSSEGLRGSFDRLLPYIK